MELCTAKQYEIKSSKANDCCICDGFNKIYNKGCGQYSYPIPQELGSGHLKQLLSCENARIMEFDINLLKQVELNGTSRIPHIDMLFVLVMICNGIYPKQVKNLRCCLVKAIWVLVKKL